MQLVSQMSRNGYSWERGSDPLTSSYYCTAVWPQLNKSFSSYDSPVDDANKSQLATVQAELGLSDPQSDRDYISIKLIASVIWKHRLTASQKLRPI